MYGHCLIGLELLPEALDTALLILVRNVLLMRGLLGNIYRGHRHQCHRMAVRLVGVMS